MKYTHRVKIGTVQLQIRYGFSDETIQKYYKDGYLYGYYADGILLGDVIEFAEGHVAFEYGLQHHNEIEEVEVEQKFYVINNDNRVMLVRMLDGKTITEADRFKIEDLYDVEKESHQLTEREIKDYDPRYFAFAEPVEEVEFRLSF